MLSNHLHKQTQNYSFPPDGIKSASSKWPSEEQSSGKKANNLSQTKEAIKKKGTNKAAGFCCGIAINVSLEASMNYGNFSVQKLVLSCI